MGKLVGSILEPFTGAKATANAGAAAAAAQEEAARLGARAAAFRPVGMTTRFGESDFTISNVGGVPRVTEASYTVAPELVSIQDRLMGLTGGALTDAEAARAAAAPLGEGAQGLFALAGQYLGQSPEAIRQQYMNEQYALLDPIRQREEQRLGSSVFGRGRAGLNVGDIGQPELFGLAAARRQQDLELASRADEAAMNRVNFGTSLFGRGAELLGNQYGLPTTALGPLSSYLGTVGTIEEMGQQPFNLGLAVGGAAQPGATAAANLLTTGLSTAANTRANAISAGNAANANFLSGLLQSGAMLYGGSQGWFGGKK